MYVYVCMYVCMYVYIYIYIFLYIYIFIYYIDRNLYSTVIGTPNPLNPEPYCNRYFGPFGPITDNP